MDGCGGRGDADKDGKVVEAHLEGVGVGKEEGTGVRKHTKEEEGTGAGEGSRTGRSEDRGLT